ncbi:MAG: hypothetical protein IJ333_01610 [Clostridia bacterium]|nr:hypothetical protein [Clostridia bacterium]
MKRKSLGCLFVGVLLLTFLLGMAGCGIGTGKNSGGSFLSIERQRISERWEENGQNNVADYSFYTPKADEAFIQVKNRDTAGPYWMNEYWLALYKDQILFQNPTLGDGLYLAYAGKDTTPQCILEKGSPIGGYGSVLYACDYSKKCYVAMDLAKGNEWISLQPWDQNVGYAVSDGKNLYYFGMSSDEDGRCYDFFVDVVELDTLQSKRVFINEELGSLVIDEEILYYVRKGESTC